VVCTLSLCAIADPARAVEEMARVLRPGGQLLLLDHIVGSSRPVRAIQRLLEQVTIAYGGEHFRRRPLHQVQAAGLDIEQQDRFTLGIVERIAARKPAAAPPPANQP
jgi:SAM-dependent methyltransferase